MFKGLSPSVKILRCRSVRVNLSMLEEVRGKNVAQDRFSYRGAKCMSSVEMHRHAINFVVAVMPYVSLLCAWTKIVHNVDTTVIRWQNTIIHKQHFSQIGNSNFMSLNPTYSSYMSHILFKHRFGLWDNVPVCKSNTAVILIYAFTSWNKLLIFALKWLLETSCTDNV